MNVSIRIWPDRSLHVALVTDYEGGGARFELEDPVDLIDAVHEWLDARVSGLSARLNSEETK